MKPDYLKLAEEFCELPTVAKPYTTFKYIESFARWLQSQEAEKGECEHHYCLKNTRLCCKCNELRPLTSSELEGQNKCCSLAETKCICSAFDLVHDHGEYCFHAPLQGLKEIENLEIFISPSWKYASELYPIKDKINEQGKVLNKIVSILKQRG